MPTKTTPENLPERFWGRVDVRGPNECWMWLGAKCGTERSGRYGRMWYAGHLRPAQQIAWELANGKPFPDGLDGLHKCDVPLCVNPSHVFPGTHTDNMRDMTAKGRNVLPVRLPHQTPRGTLHGNAVLNWERVGAIRHAHARGERIATIARGMKISKGCVAHVVHGRSWTMMHASGKPWTPEAFDGR